MKEQIDIFFYKKPIICSNINHKIFFENDDDIYNPFSNKNLALSFNEHVDEHGKLYELLYEIAVYLDLENDSYLKLKEIKPHIFNLIYRLARENSKKLISMKVPYWCMCIRFDANMPYDQRLSVFGHAFIDLYMDVLLLRDLYFIDATVQQV